jgi:hypothetical protein
MTMILEVELLGQEAKLQKPESPKLKLRARVLFLSFSP